MGETTVARAAAGKLRCRQRDAAPLSDLTHGGAAKLSRRADAMRRRPASDGTLLSMIHREDLHITTRGRSTIELTARVDDVIARAPVGAGLCTLFVHHTSASLLINENADPTVRADLERFFARLVPDGDPLFRHTAEGPDDMPAHVRAALTATSLSIPISRGRLDLGTWQGVYLWEHRAAPHRRRISVTVLG